MARTKNLQNLADTLSKECFGTSLSDAHKKKICIQCGKKVDYHFEDERSRMEYEISGLGACCQDLYFD